jgi:hypothetical protein
MARGSLGIGGAALVAATLTIGAGAVGRAQQVDRVRLLDWTAPVAPGWVWRPVTSSMPLAQFDVPGTPSAGGAEVVIYYFGPGGGGSIDANIERWTSQFTTADGRAVRPVVGHSQAGPMAVTTVELRGTYTRGVGTGPSGVPRVNHTLLALIVETAKGSLTFQLWGPTATVIARRAGIDAMVRGLTMP